MKKNILFVIMLLGITFSSQAQKISENALGLRFGNSNGFGGEISYQRKLDKDNRLELDLGWKNRSDNHHNEDLSAVQLVGLYQWVWNIDGGFNWYAGVGAGLGSWNNKYDGYHDNGIYAFAAGDIGIEYNFDIPLLISLDFRPEFGGSGYYDNSYNSDIALSLRYQF